MSKIQEKKKTRAIKRKKDKKKRKMKKREKKQRKQTEHGSQLGVLGQLQTSRGDEFPARSERFALFFVAAEDTV